MAYIKKNCWNLDNPSVTFLGTRKSRARGSEAPSSSAAPAPPTSALPSTPAPTPLAPIHLGTSAQSSELIISMLQSLHQGKLLVMQSLQDVVQQRPVMSVEEFSQRVAWPGVQPSRLGGGEASTAQEPQPDQEDDSSEATLTPPEPLIFEDDLVADPVTA